MQVLDYKGDKYPHFQSIGNASQFAIPYAKHFCKGFGYDIGCMKKEWSFPGSYPIDLSFVDPSNPSANVTITGSGTASSANVGNSVAITNANICLLYTSPSPRDRG